MKASVYLVLNRRGVDRMAKRRIPELRGGEVAVKLAVEVDDRHFRSPLAEASLAIAGEHLIQPEAEVSVTPPDIEGSP